MNRMTWLIVALLGLFVTGQTPAEEKTTTTSYEDFLEWGKRLEGRWVGQTKISADWPEFGKKKGDSVPGHLTFRWVADKRGLEAVFVAGESEFRGLGYYDAGTKQIKEVIVSSSGTTWVNTLRRKGDQWHWRISGHLGDGQKIEGKGVSTLKGDGTFVVEGTFTLGGKEMLKFRDEYKKVSKEPSK
jgi:hypothetical protein